MSTFIIIKVLEYLKKEPLLIFETTNH